jgi:deazaflavin-dependent oxidoreductase (nitroreductase family)
MKIPEPLFAIINRIVHTLLRSPLHWLMSSSFMVIYYRGRKSGKPLHTPVRYMPIDGGVRATTADHTQWWRNVAANPDVQLLVGGKRRDYTAQLHERDPQSNRELLIEFLTVYPQDAVYQDIRLNKDGSLNEHDLKEAATRAIIIDFIESP